MSAQTKPKARTNPSQIWRSPTNKILAKAGKDFIAKLRETLSHSQPPAKRW